MIHESVHEIRHSVKGILGVENGKVEVLDDAKVRQQLIDTLARAMLSLGHVLSKRLAAGDLGIGPGIGCAPCQYPRFLHCPRRDKWQNRTVPAMNMRFTTYDSGCAAIRAAKKTHSAAFIFEIARSEMGYTYQEPAEFSAMLIAAAIKEGYQGPLFIQGDHFQVNSKKYAKDPEGAIQEVKDLIATAVPAGFWNIDIDTSTLVTLEPESLDEQQLHNYRRSAELTEYIRNLQPEGVTISLGGEIGEVGEKNSTVEELDAYVEGYQRTLAEMGDYAGLSKISVQTGTSHGGVLLPDGTQASVAVDFETLDKLGERARQLGSGGAVQHGASTLPRELFDKFPAVQTLEIHLATGFMNAFLDHKMFPEDLRQEMYRHLNEFHASERKPSHTDIVFQLTTRKKAIGPFKPELWGLSESLKQEIYSDLEGEFRFFYEKLNIVDTKDLVAEIVKPVEYHKPMPKFGRGAGDDQGLAD
jgi:fructose/tagatose bisphosphate aldolase